MIACDQCYQNLKTEDEVEELTSSNEKHMGAAYTNI